MPGVMVKNFRQIALWPVQLMPVRPGQQVQRHWELLDAAGGSGAWRTVNEAGAGGDGAFSRRHYKEFVTFLPYVRRFLYGSAAGQEAATAHTDCSIHRYAREDVRRVRVVSREGSAAVELEIGRIELMFFLDADIALLVFEMHALKPTAMPGQNSAPNRRANSRGCGLLLSPHQNRIILSGSLVVIAGVWADETTLTSIF